MINLTYEDLLQRAEGLARKLPPRDVRVYGVPRGGVYASLLLLTARPSLVLAENPADADCIVDDIIDSGKTRERFIGHGVPFLALVDKLGRDKDWAGKWVSFPWERMTREDGPEDAVVRLLQYIGEDPTREGLRETPARVLRSYAELFAGYRQDPADVVKCFEDGACDEMVLLKDCPVDSCCEHHLLPFGGVAHVAYVPDGRVIGLSKLARLVDVFARRLQMQERLTEQITAALDGHLNPKGSACVLECYHSCLGCRGARKVGARMVTSSLTGVFRDKPEARAEFFQLVRG